MNTTNKHPGYSTLLAAFGLAALPPELYQRVVAALQPGATLAQIHDAAHAIANDCPTTCLQGVISTLVFLANPDVDLGQTQKGPTHG